MAAYDPNDFFSMGADSSAPSSAKQDSVNKAKLTKETKFSSAELSNSFEQFKQANPNSTFEQQKYFLDAKKVADAKRNLGMLGDIGTDLSIAFGDNLPKVAAGAYGLITGDERAFEYAAKQEAEAEESRQTEYSAGLRNELADTLKRRAERKARFEADGEITAGETVEDFIGTVGDYIANPRTAVSDAVQSADALVSMVATGYVGGAVARQATTAAIKKKLKDEVKERASTALIKKGIQRKGTEAATKTAGATGVGLTGVYEGTSNALGTRDALLALDEETLSKSDDFNNLRKANPELSFEDARKEFALSGARDTALISGAIAAAIGKVSGASDAASTALTKGAKKSGVVAETVKGAAKETVEETLQSGSGELVSNIQVKEGDVDKEILEDVGSAAASGAVAGGLTGGAVSGSGRTVTKTAEVATKAKETVAKWKAEKATSTTEAEPVKPTPVEPAATTVEAFAPERSPVVEEPKEAAKIAQRADELKTKYENHETDNESVKEVLGVASHLMTQAVDQLSATALGEETGAGDIFTKAAAYRDAMTQMSGKALDVMQGSNITPEDKAVLSEIVEGSIPEIAPEQAISAVVSKLEKGELDTFLETTIQKYTSEGNTEDAASKQAMIDSLANVVLYSKDMNQTVSPEVLTQLADGTSNPEAKELLTLTANLRNIQLGNVEGASAKMVKVAKQLFSASEERSVSAHVDNLLKAFGEGNVIAAEQTQDAFTSYLVRTQGNKIDAYKSVLEKPAGKHKISWDTSGLLGQGFQEKNIDSSTPKQQAALANLVQVMESELGALTDIDNQISKVLGRDAETPVSDTETVKTESGTDAQPTPEKPSGKLTEADTSEILSTLNTSPETPLSEAGKVEFNILFPDTNPKKHPTKRLAELPVADKAKALEWANKHRVEPEAPLTGEARTQATLEKAASPKRTLAYLTEEEAKAKLAESATGLEEFTQEGISLTGSVAEQEAKINEAYVEPEGTVDAKKKYRADYIEAKNAYLSQLAETNAALEEASTLRTQADLLEEGKAVAEPDAVTVDNQQRTSRLANVLSKATVRFKSIATAVGIPADKFEAAKGKSYAIQKLLEDSYANLAASTVATRLTEAVSNLKGAIETGSRDIHKAFSKTYGNLISGSESVSEFVGTLSDDSPLKASVESFKDTPLWDSEHLLNRDPSTLNSQEAAIVKDYASFKATFLKAAAYKSKDAKNVIEFMYDQDGNVAEHFIQSAFLAYAETAEFIGDSQYVPTAELNKYTEALEGVTPAQLTGMGTLLPESVIEGAVTRHTYLIEDNTSAQSIPAVKAYLTNMIIHVLNAENPSIKAEVRIIDNVHYRGYIRNPESGFIGRGELGLLKDAYDLKASRENHIGTPPNTDYSDLTPAQREMAEVTENTPYYFNTDMFNTIVANLTQDTDGEVHDLQEVAEQFAITYFGSATDAELDKLNVNHRAAEEGKRKGLERDFIAAYKLNERLSEGEVPANQVGIYFSSHFAVTGRQHFEGEVNPQASTLHRILVRTAFNKKVKGTAKSVNQWEAAYKRTKGETRRKYDNFLLGMALGLGADVDKNSNDSILKGDSVKGIPSVWEQMRELEKFITETGGIEVVGDYMQAKVSQGKKVSPEEMEAVNAFLEGKRNPLPFEVDGKTNGPFHANWFYGLSYKGSSYSPEELLALGGMKQDKSAPDTHHDDASMDLYRKVSTEGDVARQINISNAEEFGDKYALETRATLESKDIGISDEVDEYTRIASKGGTTSTVYGGSSEALNKGLLYGAKSGQGYLAHFYNEVTEWANDTGNKDKADAVKAWGKILDGRYPKDGTEFLNSLVGKSQAELKEHLLKLTLTPVQINNMADAIGSSVGKDISDGIEEVLFGARQATNDVTLATGLMTAVYNMALKKVSGKVATGQTLSKAEEKKIKNAVRSLFPSISGAVEGNTVLRKHAHETKQGGLTYINVPSPYGKRMLKGKETQGTKKVALVQGVPLREQAGVKATPQLIISADAEMQRKTTKLIKEITKTLQLNVFDAQDISTGSDLQLNALLTNLGEVMTLFGYDPLQNVADAFSEFKLALNKPVSVDGEVVLTSMNKALANSTGEVNQDTLELLGELGVELGHRDSSGKIVTAIGAFKDINGYLNILEEILQNHAKEGELARRKMLASGGLKIQQLAGVDGTGILLNADGTIDWDGIGSNLADANYTKALDIVKSHPDVVAFEKSLQEKVTGIEDVVVPTLSKDAALVDGLRIETKQDALREQKEVFGESASSQLIALANQGKVSYKRNEKEGTTTYLVGEEVYNVLGKPKGITKLDIGAFTEFAAAPFAKERAKLVKRKTKIVVVDAARTDDPRYYLDKGANGVHMPQENTIYLRDGVSFEQFNQTLKHELTHSVIDEGIYKAIELATKKAPKNMNKQEREIYQLVKGVSAEINALRNAKLDKTTEPKLVHLQAILKEIDADNSRNAVTKVNISIHEYLAYINENPAEVAKYLKGDVDAATAKVASANLIRGFIQKLGGFINKVIDTIVGKTDTSYTRAALVQAAFVGLTKARDLKYKTGVPTATRQEQRSAPVEEQEPVMSQRHDEEQLAHLNDLQGIVEKSVLNKFDVGNIEDQAEFLTVTNSTERAMTSLASDLEFTVTEFKLASQLAGLFHLGSQKKYYQFNHAAKLFRYAKENLKPTDLIPVGIERSDSSYKAELAKATRIYNSIFNAGDRAKLARFVAISQVSPQVRKAMSKLEPVEKLDRKSTEHIFTQLREAIRYSMVRLGHFLGRIPTGKADKQILETVRNAAKAKAHAQTKLNVKLKEYEQKVNTPIKYGAAQSLKGLKYSLAYIFRRPEIKDVSFKDAILQYVPSDLEASPAGFIRNTFMEFLPRDEEHSKKVDAHTDRVKYDVDGARNRVTRATREALSGIFGAPLNEKENRAVLDGEIKGDLASLVQAGFTQDQITNLLADPQELANQVNIAQQEILNTRLRGVSRQHKAMQINEAKALGYRMVLGGATKGMNFPNAYAISKLSGTPLAIGDKQVHTRLIPAIDKLASLSAIQHMNQETKNNLVVVRTREKQRTDGGNGIDALGRHLANTTDSLVNRHGSKIRNQMPKGYVPNLNDSTRSVKVVDKDTLDKLIGYEVIRTVKLPHKTEPHYVVFNPNGGNVPYVSAAMSLVESTLTAQARGETNLSNLNYWDSIKVTKSNVAKYATSMTTGLREPEPLTEGGMVPNMNANGDIVGYHFELPQTDTDTMLNTNKDFVETLSEYTGRISEENVALKSNRTLVEELHRQYVDNPEGFVKVHADSPHKQVSEAWALMPKDMKAHAKTIFGEAAVYVHRDDINQVLGYREKSVTNLLQPENYETGSVKHITAKVLNTWFGGKGASSIRYMEKLLQEFVTDAKDLIVVKSMVVPAANIASNVNQLSLRGVAMEDIGKDMVLAINAKRAYDVGMDEVYFMRSKLNMMEAGAEKMAYKREMEDRIREVQNNPVYRLIKEEGLNPAVIEELGEEANRDTVKSGLVERLGLGKPYGENAMVDVGKEVIITQDSNLYKLLNEGLEMGDFVAKFVLYNHLTKNEGVSHAEAVEQVRSEFINYNRAQNSTLDYLNKTGMMFFFKYFMRIQPIIMNSIKKNPSRAMAQVMTLTGLGVPSPYEAFLLSKDLGAATGTVDLLDMATGAHPWLNI